MYRRRTQALFKLLYFLMAFDWVFLTSSFLLPSSFWRRYHLGVQVEAGKAVFSPHFSPLLLPFLVWTSTLNRQYIACLLFSTVKWSLHLQLSRPSSFIPSCCNSVLLKVCLCCCRCCSCLSIYPMDNTISPFAYLHKSYSSALPSCLHLAFICTASCQVGLKEAQK